MTSLVSQLAGFAHNTLGQSRAAVGLAIKIKNQCDMIIGVHMADGHVLSASGEEWLASVVAPHARNFVDVGANVGQWSLAFARRMIAEPEGLLFEPSPETAARLRMVLAREGLDKLEVIQRAASERAGQAVFYAEPGFGETSSLFIAANSVPALAVPVILTRLDDELSARSFSQLDFLKVDAEGNDFNVLLGAENYISSRHISVIQFEYNSSWMLAGATLSRAFDFFQTHGYKVRLLKSGMLGEFDIRRTGEFFKYCNFIAYCPSELGEILDRQNHYSVL